MKKINILLLLLANLFSQVSPFSQPYNINSEYILDLEMDRIIFNFQDSEKIKVSNKNEYIFQKTFNLKSNQRIILNIENNIDCDGVLFLRNLKDEFSGPYEIDKVEKTNPFKAEKLIVQYIGAEECDIESLKFSINPYQSMDIVNNKKHEDLYYQKREEPIILITGYWPPTNEMIREFSQNLDLNPSGWIGDNWEDRGYDIVSFFPEFSDPECDNCGQGYGDLEVDYQDTSEDYWPIVENIRPIAIITFSRGYIDYSWELEYNYYNRLNWIGDFYPPYLPTPNPPDNSVENYFLRNSSLPINEIMQDILDENIGLDSYIDWSGDPGHYVSEFMGYHGVWYHDTNQNGDDKCITAGHVHVGGLIDVQTAKRATEVTLRSVINYLDLFDYIPGDINQDEIIDILDLVMVVNYILGIQDFETIQIYASDINEDGLINIQDIISLINIILQN